MRLVVGLGNPGRKYDFSPHNVGFSAIDALAEKLGCKLKKSLRLKAVAGEAVFGDEKLLLIKPETFMNNSGLAVSAVARRKNVDLSSMIVLLDDADLSLGHLRIRDKGGDGGHNGLLSIAQVTGVSEFVRVRMGIGRCEHGRSLTSYVLSRFPKDKQDLVRGMTDRAAEAVLCILEHDIDRAMNDFN